MVIKKEVADNIREVLKIEMDNVRSKIRCNKREIERLSYSQKVLKSEEKKLWQLINSLNN
jgi:hypothetical protein